MKVSRGLTALAMVMLAVPVCAQSLGELAKKEAERRKATPPATKVYTNDDLKKIYVPEESKDGKDTKDAKDAKDAKDGKEPADAKAPGAADAATEPAAAADAKDAAPAMDEAAWRAKIDGAREDLRKGEMFRDALQSRINGLTADYTARDDPFQRAQIADERQKALTELTRVTEDIEKAKKAIADIQEEARRANVPAGWVR